MIGLGEHPSNSFQGKTCNYRLKERIVFRFDNLKSTICSSLKWLIDCLHNDTNTSFVVRVFSIVTIQISYSLLFMLTWQPVLYEILYLSSIHELNIVHMSILLPFNHNIRRNAFVTHSLWIWFVVFASTVHFVPYLRRRKAVVALYFSRMNSFAFEFLLVQPVVKGDVGDIRNELLIEAVDTFAIWTMLAQHLCHSFLVFKVDFNAVKTLSIWPMVAFLGLFNYLIGL